MENKSRISVVIPVYNTKNYLVKCVKSVINQTHKNLEIILVDDGSYDGSEKICDYFGTIDERLKVIHQANQGLSAARNAGIDAATGHWIAFLDSDDWIEETMYEKLYGLALKYDADISSCGTRKIFYGKDVMEKNEYSNESVIIFDDEKMIEGLLTQENIRFEVWNKLWKRDLIGNVRFIEGQVSEDIHFDRLMFMRANKLVHTTVPLHNYLVSRPGSTNTSFKLARMCVYEEFDKWIESYSANAKIQEIINVLAADFAIGMYESAVITKQKKEIIAALGQLFDKYYYNSRGSQYRNLKNKIKLRIFSLNKNLFMKMLNFLKH